MTECDCAPCKLDREVRGSLAALDTAVGAWLERHGVAPPDTPWGRRRAFVGILGVGSELEQSVSATLYELTGYRSPVIDYRDMVERDVRRARELAERLNAETSR